ncbi:MAG: Gamma-glutamyl-hercynylcysteine sulfoxide hydrolase [Nitrospira sp.]|nr:Gamma-glutamyl-hercynylcysteine sulfoxide hydrolase [Nitrospira sp.]
MLVGLTTRGSNRNRPEFPARIGSVSVLYSGRLEGSTEICRLLGYAAAEEISAESILGGLQCQAFLDMGRLHADGWGTASVSRLDQPSVVRTRDTAAGHVRGTDAAAALTQSVIARIFHLRQASPEFAICLENTHPFLVDGVAFAHNGALTPVDKLRVQVHEAALADVEGQTDSELYFALVRQNQSEHDSLLGAIVESARQLRRDYVRGSLNALVLTTGELVCVHASVNSRVPDGYFESRGVSAADIPPDHDGSAYYQMFEKRLTDGSIVFASSGIDTDGWQPLPAETVTSVNLKTFEVLRESLA